MERYIVSCVVQHELRRSLIALPNNNIWGAPNIQDDWCLHPTVESIISWRMYDERLSFCTDRGWGSQFCRCVDLVLTSGSHELKNARVALPISRVYCN